MKVFYSPQVNMEDTLTYDFVGDKIIATLNGDVDEFDFTGMPDGEVSATEYRELPITSTLPICPIVHARKADGILYVTLTNFISIDAPYEDRFPEWKDV